MSLRESLGTTNFGPVAGAGPVEDERVDNFMLETQARDNWCWAAVATSIARQQNSPIVLTQCQIVELALPCADCLDALCDMPGDVVRALDDHNLTAVPGTTPAPDLDTALDALHHERPVICRVRKEPNEVDSLPHVVVIVRANRGSATVTVKDPSKDRYFDKRWDLASFATHCIEHFILE